jgi:hypothetical protein
MELTVALLIIQIGLSSALTLLILIIMLRQPLTPNLRVRFEEGGKVTKHTPGENITLRFYIENVGTLLAKPAAIEVRGWLNFPSTLEIKQIESITGISNDVGPSIGGIVEGMNVISLPGFHNLFYKERWNFDMKVTIPPESGKAYPISIPLYHERGNCSTEVLKIKVI